MITKDHLLLFIYYFMLHLDTLGFKQIVPDTIGEGRYWLLIFFNCLYLKIQETCLLCKVKPVLSSMKPSNSRRSFSSLFHVISRLQLIHIQMIYCCLCVNYSFILFFLWALLLKGIELLDSIAVHARKEINI